jgi:hypothetical protein
MGPTDMLQETKRQAGVARVGAGGGGFGMVYGSLWHFYIYFRHEYANGEGNL